MIKYFKSKSAFSLVMTLITATFIGFIWYQSSLVADDSAQESLALLDFLNGFLKSLGLGESLTDHIIRKSAHFLEFSLLGFLTAWTGWLLNRKIIKNLTSIGFVCLLTAVVDESIQYFSAGRSAQVNDIVLDFSGAVFGLLLFLLINGIVGLFRKAKR